MISKVSKYWYEYLQIVARNSIVKYVPYNTMCIKKFKKYKPKSCIEFKVDKLNFVYLYFKIN